MLKQSQKVEHWNDARNLNQTHTSAQSSWGGGGGERLTEHTPQVFQDFDFP